MKTSELSKRIQKSKIRVMYDLAAKKDPAHVLSFTVGEPDFKTPQEIIDVSNRYFSEGYTKYTPNSGIQELKDAIARKYEPVLGREIDAENEVIITAGATEALLVAMQTVMNPGDEIICCEPCFPSYLNQAYICFCNPVIVKTTEEGGWMPHASDIEAAITDKTRMLLLNSPCNPTGAMIDAQTLSEIADVCIRHDIVVISDEVYKDIRYTGEDYVSIASLPGMAERTVVVNAFSKTYAMPGWRLGYAVGPSWIVGSMPKTHDATVVCIPAPFQYAGAYALENCDEQAEEMRQEFERRKELIYNGINEIKGLSAIEPKGAFYLFFSIKETGMTSEEFAFALLEEEDMVVVPGSGFGEAGEGYIRISYAADPESLKEGLRRLAHFMEKH